MRFASIILSLCLAMVAGAQVPSTKGLDDRIDAIARQTLSRPVAGISIAMARNGQLVLARGYGMANLEHSVPVTPETVFHIASISKNIEAAVVLQLVEQGRLRLDDDVTKYVPEAPTHGAHVTVRQLLNHTSGIYSFTSLPDAAENERRDLTHDQVLGLIKDKPLDFEPGTSWRYDNSAFYLAGMVVERVTKQDYGFYVREHIFGPLGMHSASLCDARMVVPRLASGYETDHGQLANASFLSWKLPFAAGAVCATAIDLLKWQAALDDGRVIGPSSLSLMRTPTALADGTKIDYGLGARLGVLDGHCLLGHTGSGGGFQTVLMSLPDDHLTIVVLVNTDPGSATLIATAIARAALGFTEKTLRDLPLSKEEAAVLPGIFDSDDGTTELFVLDGKLRFRDRGSTGDGAPLLRQAENVYAIDKNAEVHFVMRDGRAMWGVLYVGGLMMGASRRVQ